MFVHVITCCHINTRQLLVVKLISNYYITTHNYLKDHYAITVCSTCMHS